MLVRDRLVGRPAFGKRGRSRSGFTLLEVVVVCVILSLLAGLVTLSLSGRIRKTRLNQAVGSIMSADRVARTVAQNSGAGATLVVDGSDNEIRVESGRRTHKTVKLPTGVTLSTFRVQRKGSRTSGDIVVSRSGQSLSYGIELTVGQHSRWLVVSGVSGQVHEVGNVEQANALLRL